MWAVKTNQVSSEAIIRTAGGGFLFVQPGKLTKRSLCSVAGVYGNRNSREPGSRIECTHNLEKRNHDLENLAVSIIDPVADCSRIWSRFFDPLYQSPH
jgi:hypothetical protein